MSASHHPLNYEGEMHMARIRTSTDGCTYDPTGMPERSCIALALTAYMQATEATKILQKELKEADTDNSGLIDFQEFQNYYLKLARYQQNEARLQRLRGNRKTIPSGELFRAVAS